MTETAPSVEERTSSAVQPGDLTAKLMECREKAGLDIDQTAEELHLSSHILRALETEDFARLPEPPYVRGYLRGYAKLADLDTKELIRIYEALRGANPDEIAHHFAPARPLNKVAQPAISTSTLKFIGFGALVLLLGLFSMIPGVREWAGHTWSSFSAQTNPPDVPRPPSAMEAYSAQKAALEQEKAQAEQQAQQAVATSQTPAPAAPAPATTPAPAAAEAVTPPPATPSVAPAPPPAASTKQDVATAAQTTDTAVTPAPATPITPPVTGTATTNTAQTATTPPTAPTVPAAAGTDPATAAAATTPLLAGEVSIKMEFAEEVWMQIKGDDKKTLFESLNTAGTIKEFKATPPLNFKIGNASGVKIFLNGQPFDAVPHTKGSVARFKVE